MGCLDASRLFANGHHLRFTTIPLRRRTRERTWALHQGVSAWVSKVTTNPFPLGTHMPSSAGSLPLRQRFMSWADPSLCPGLIRRGRPGHQGRCFRHSRQLLTEQVMNLWASSDPCHCIPKRIEAVHPCLVHFWESVDPSVGSARAWLPEYG